MPSSRPTRAPGSPARGRSARTRRWRGTKARGVSTTRRTFLAGPRAVAIVTTTTRAAATAMTIDQATLDDTEKGHLQELRRLNAVGVCIEGRSLGEAIFRERAFRQTAPLSRLCSTHDLLRDVYASFGYVPDAIPFWKRTAGAFRVPGAITDDLRASAKKVRSVAVGSRR